MPVEPFPHQAIERRRHDRHVAEGNLIFNNCMSRGMRPSVFTDRQAPSAVILDDLVDAVLLIELEPSLGVGRLAGIVTHGKPLLSSPRAGCVEHDDGLSASHASIAHSEAGKSAL